MTEVGVRQRDHAGMGNDRGRHPKSLAVTGQIPALHCSIMSSFVPEVVKDPVDRLGLVGLEVLRQYPALN